MQMLENTNKMTSFMHELVDIKKQVKMSHEQTCNQLLQLNSDLQQWQKQTWKCLSDTDSDISGLDFRVFEEKQDEIIVVTRGHVLCS